MEPIIRGFARAGLDLLEARAPLARGPTARQVFGLTIRTARRREAYELWSGRARLAVLGPDRSLRQVVLFVHEPPVVFQEWVSRYQGVRRTERVLREERHRRLIERMTPDQKRWYLCGHDEQHLFIAELPRHASTVADAHRLLKSGAVLAAEGRSQDVVRQGEWFFIETSRAERHVLDQLSERGLTRHQVAIGSGLHAQPYRRRRWGNPHVVDELAMGRAVQREKRLSGDRYVRGQVRHVDHRTVRLPLWRRVELNAQENNSAVVGWVD